MKKWLGLLLFSGWAFHGQAQVTSAPVNDTVYTMQLQDVTVTDARKWANDTVRYHYNQKRYYVTTILPYLDAAVRLFNEINAETNDPHISKKERKVFLNQKEDEMRTQFEDKVKALNITQGVLLTQLIARQTGVNIYKMLGEFKNPFTAIKWQTWAKWNGMNLNKRYDPNDDPDLEHIMNGLGYPLPALYRQDEVTSALQHP